MIPIDTNIIVRVVIAEMTRLQHIYGATSSWYFAQGQLRALCELNHEDYATAYAALEKYQPR